METIDWTSVFIILVILVFLFFMLREVNLWYWKINRKIELMEETNYLLKKLLSEHDGKKQTQVTEKSTPPEESSVNDPKVMKELLKKISK